MRRVFTLSAKQKIVYVFQCPYCEYSCVATTFVEAIAKAEAHIKGHKYSRFDVTKHIKTYKVIE